MSQFGTREGGWEVTILTRVESLKGIRDSSFL